MWITEKTKWSRPLIPIRIRSVVPVLQPSEASCNLTMVKVVELGPAGAPSIGCFKPAKNVFWGKAEGQSVSIWIDKLFPESESQGQPAARTDL